MVQSQGTSGDQKKIAMGALFTRNDIEMLFFRRQSGIDMVISGVL
jgi:hypothetical protein